MVFKDLGINELKDMINLCLYVIGGGVLTIITGIVTIIHQSRAFKKQMIRSDLDNTGVGIDNQKKELELSQIIHQIASESAVSAVDFLNSIQKLQSDMISVKAQLETEKAQKETLQIEIDKVKTDLIKVNCQLVNYKLFTQALTKQMKENRIDPIKIEDVPGYTPVE